MITRREWTRRLAAAAAGSPLMTEMALAQQSRVRMGNAPPGTVWINANENPEGPPEAALEAMRAVLAETNRYHFAEFGEFYAAVARSEGLETSQVLVGAGSSEILHTAVSAFCSPGRPLVTVEPTFELPPHVAGAVGAPVRRLPLNAARNVDVQRVAEEAAKAAAGVIYLCNPNNPTSAMIPAKDVRWLVANLPGETILLLDEAYIHYSPDMDALTGLPFVKGGRNVVLCRTFSKIYGMAGLRVGFGCARPDLIARMEPFRDGVISIVSARATLAALNGRERLIGERRQRNLETRGALCAWLREKGIDFIEPHANFLMLDVKRDVRPLLGRMLAQGVGVGRHFPPLDTMMRVTIGAAAEMEKFRGALARVLAV